MTHKLDRFSSSWASQSLLSTPSCSYCVGFIRSHTSTDRSWICTRCTALSAVSADVGLAAPPSPYVNLNAPTCGPSLCVLMPGEDGQEVTVTADSAPGAGMRRLLSRKVVMCQILMSELEHTDSSEL